MICKVLNINDTYVTAQPAELVCYGLGTCVGVFVSDRTIGLVAGAHIAMPFECEAGMFSGAEKLIDKLLDGLKELGSDLNSLRAKITGGSQLFESSLMLGTMNSDEIQNQLLRRKIFIASHDCGGRVSRTARYNSITLDLEITTSEKKTYII